MFLRLTTLSYTIAALTLGSTASEAAIALDKRVETLRKIDAIEQAMDAFSLTYGRIPCPADSSLTVSNSSFGKEQINGINCAADTGQTISETMAGTVPVRTLSLPDSFMFDGWGRRMVYVVDQRFAGKGSFQQDLTSAGVTLPSYDFMAKGDIEIRDTVGGTILNSATDDRTIGLLISYGQNGRAAFTHQGIRLDAGTDTDELENSHYQTGGSFNITFIKKDPTSSFDDIIHVVTRNTNIPLHCLGIDVASRTGGHTAAGPGYPAYDWPNATAGSTETQPCSTEYTGTVTRVCDANGEWQTVTTTCNCDAKLLTDSTTYSGTWPKGDDIGTLIGGAHTLTEAADDVCMPGLSGDVTAQCQSSGGWGVTANNCVP